MFLNKKMSSTKPASNNKGGLKSPVIPEGLYNKFITQQLKQAYTNSFGEYAYGFIVGNRIGQYEKFINKIRADTNCKIFIQLDEKKINIVSSDIDKLAKAIDYIANINNLMKTNGVAIVKETVEIKIKNVTMIFDIINECITLECPAVTVKVNTSSVDFFGPSQQVRIAVDGFNKIYSSRFGVKKEKEREEKKMEVTINLIEMTPEYREHLKQFIQHIDQNIEIIDPDEYIDENGDLIFELEVEQPEKMDNYQVKPPSKLSHFKKGSKSSEKTKMFSEADLYLDEEQAYGCIIKMYGNSRAEVKIISQDDELTDSSVIGRFSSNVTRRNKSNKRCRMNRLEVGDLVIVSKRDFDEKKVDIIDRVNDTVARMLVRKNIIDGNFKRFLNNQNVAVEDERCNFDFDYNDYDINFDDI
jgi:translation initiation factor IF-1